MQGTESVSSAFMICCFWISKQSFQEMSVKTILPQFYLFFWFESHENEFCWYLISTKFLNWISTLIVTIFSKTSTKIVTFRNLIMPLASSFDGITILLKSFVFTTSVLCLMWTTWHFQEISRKLSKCDSIDVTIWKYLAIYSWFEFYLLFWHFCVSMYYEKLYRQYFQNHHVKIHDGISDNDFCSFYAVPDFNTSLPPWKRHVYPNSRVWIH